LNDVDLNQQALTEFLEKIKAVPGCDINLRINYPKSIGGLTTYQNHKLGAKDLWQTRDRRQLSLLNMPEGEPTEDAAAMVEGG
jgi:hypothetical protein